MVAQANQLGSYDSHVNRHDPLSRIALNTIVAQGGGGPDHRPVDSLQWPQTLNRPLSCFVASDQDLPLDYSPVLDITLDSDSKQAIYISLLLTNPLMIIAPDAWWAPELVTGSTWLSPAHPSCKHDMEMLLSISRVPETRNHRICMMLTKGLAPKACWVTIGSWLAVPSPRPGVLGEPLESADRLLVTGFAVC